MERNSKGSEENNYNWKGFFSVAAAVFGVGVHVWLARKKRLSRLIDEEIEENKNMMAEKKEESQYENIVEELKEVTDLLTKRAANGGQTPELLLKEAAELHEGLKEHYSLKESTLLYSLGSVAYKLSSFGLAKSAFKELLNLELKCCTNDKKSEQKDVCDVPLSYLNLGLISYAEKNYEESRKYLLQAISKENEEGKEGMTRRFTKDNIDASAVVERLLKLTRTAIVRNRVPVDGIASTEAVSNSRYNKLVRKGSAVALQETDLKFMNIALEEAKKGYEEGGIPIGSCIVIDGVVRGRGHNRRVQNGSPILHGEMDAFQNAGRLTASEYRKASLYTTLSPCDMCSGTILLYEIPRVIMAENRTFMGGESLLKDRGVEVINLNIEKAYQMMQKFIKENPTLWNEDIGEDDEKKAISLPSIK